MPRRNVPCFSSVIITTILLVTICTKYSRRRWHLSEKFPRFLLADPGQFFPRIRLSRTRNTLCKTSTTGGARPCVYTGIVRLLRRDLHIRACGEKIIITFALANPVLEDFTRCPMTTATTTTKKIIPTKQLLLLPPYHNVV